MRRRKRTECRFDGNFERPKRWLCCCGDQVCPQDDLKELALRFNKERKYCTRVYDIKKKKRKDEMKTNMGASIIFILQSWDLL